MVFHQARLWAVLILGDLAGIFGPPESKNPAFGGVLTQGTRARPKLENPCFDENFIEKYQGWQGISC